MQIPRGHGGSEGSIGKVSMRCVFKYLQAGTTSAFAVGMLRDIFENALGQTHWAFHVEVWDVDWCRGAMWVWCL